MPVTVTGSGDPGDPYIVNASLSVTTGCGVTGSGTAGSPLIANTNAWPYACAIGTNGGTVACDPATGKLYSTPLGLADFKSTTITRTYASLAVPASGSSVTLDTFDFSFTNDDPCRNARVVIWRNVEVNFDLPGTGTTGPSRAAFAIDGNACYRISNTGATTATSTTTEVSRAIGMGTFGPGAVVNYSLDVGGLDGSGGATYTRIEATARALFIPTV